METSQLIKLGAGGLIGGVVGFFAGRYFMDKFMAKEEAESYIGDVMKDYTKFDDDGLPDQDRKKMAGEEEKPLKDLEPLKDNLATEDNSRIDYTVFNKTKKKPDIEELARNLISSTEKPKIISFDEFCANTANHLPVNLTYWEFDGVLTDRDDNLIPDIAGTIGLESLSNFGNGSEDPDIVYVRNAAKKIDYEVTRVDASYSESVEGLIVEEERPKRKKDKKNGAK